MTHEMPLYMQICNLDKELKRTDRYLQYYRQTIKKKDLICLQKCSELICLLANQNSQEENVSSDISTDFDDVLIEVITEHRKLAGLYQDEEKMIKQMRLRIKEREEIAANLEKQIEEVVRQEGKKKEIKDLKLFKKKNRLDEESLEKSEKVESESSRKRSFSGEIASQIEGVLNKSSRKIE